MLELFLATQWFFAVTAVDVPGVESGYSNVAAKTIDDVAGGSAVLTWTPPTQYTDGKPLTALFGYRIYWGAAPGNYTSSAHLDEPGATTYAVVFPAAPPQTVLPPALTSSAFSCAPANQCIPAPPALFQSTDIGSPALVGSYAVSNGTHTVRGAGADIWFAADQFRFAYTTLSGDGEITARVASLDNTDVWAKAGVMIRESTAPGSRYAFMLVSSMRGVDLQWRTAANQNAQQQISDMTTRPPRWLRLTRTGNVFRGYHSADGVTWTLYSTQTIALSASTLVGLAVTSHNVAASAAGVFDSVVIR